MNLSSLIAVYLIVGLACAVAVYRSAPSGGRQAALSAAVTVPLWPLWAPFALTSSRGPAAPVGDGPEGRIERSLAAALRAIADTPVARELTREDADKIMRETQRAAARLRELDAHISQQRADATDGECSAHGGRSADPQTVARARLHEDGVDKLNRLRQREARSLEDLAELVELLRTQLLLARFDASSSESIVGLKHELWARLGGEVMGHGAAEAEADGDGGGGPYNTSRPSGHS